jgi:4-hydroxybenzoate 3-monooxygenase
LGANRAAAAMTTRALRTQVTIVGAGPAGLTLARLLQLAGIESVVLESRSREYVEQRIRAGVLEQGSVDLLDAAGLGARMRREGIVHHGIHLQFDGERHYVPLSELTGGREIVIYGQTEVVKDLIAARPAEQLPLRFETGEVSVHDVETERPSVRFTHGGAGYELSCDVIAGCDGFHGVCRAAIEEHLRVFSREYPYGWLGILAAVAPSRRRATSSSIPITSAASPSSACAPRSSAASLSSATPTTTSRTGRTSGFGRSFSCGWRLTGGRSTRDRCSRRGSPECVASSRSRC